MSPAENYARVAGAYYYYVRTDNKDYGLGQRIEGDKALLDEFGMVDVVITEGLINSGMSSRITALLRVFKCLLRRLLV